MQTSRKEREEGVDPLTWGSWSVHSHKWFQISIPATCSTESWTWWPRPWKWRALGLGASGAVQGGVSNWSARVPAAPLEPDRTGHVVVLRCSTWLCQATAHYSSQDEQWLDRAQSFWWPPESVIYEHVSVPVYDSCRLSLSLSRDHPSRGEDRDEIQVFWVCPWQQCCPHRWRATGADQVSSSRGEFQTSLLPTYQSWAEVRSKETSKSERQRNRKATVTDFARYVVRWVRRQLTRSFMPSL